MAKGSSPYNHLYFSGCSRVGEVKLQLDNAYSGEQNVIEVTFMAGHTELQVQARHAATNKKIVASFRFLR